MSLIVLPTWMWIPVIQICSLEDNIARTASTSSSGIPNFESLPVFRNEWTLAEKSGFSLIKTLRIILIEYTYGIDMYVHLQTFIFASG